MNSREKLIQRTLEIQTEITQAGLKRRDLLKMGLNKQRRDPSRIACSSGFVPIWQDPVWIANVDDTTLGEED